MPHNSDIDKEAAFKHEKSIQGWSNDTFIFVKIQEIMNKEQNFDNHILNIAVSNWVAITDALPNANEEVLTITADGWYRVMTYGSTGSRFGYKIYGSQVTHWMHLPKPPC